MTTSQFVALILAAIGVILILVALTVTTADARLGWIGSMLIGLGVIFLALADKID
jgi:Na+/phosphate symporter